MTTNINTVSLFVIPKAMNDRMVFIKPCWMRDHSIRTWSQAVNYLIKHFWGEGADCGFTLEARACFDEGGTYNSYDAAVTIYPDGRFAVRLIH